MTKTKIILNGKFEWEDEASISINNRSFRYGDGCFETMKLMNGKILLQDFHFERLFSSLDVLKFEKRKYFDSKHLQQQIIELAEKNNHQKLARIRMTVFRGDGGLYDAESNTPNYLIQTWALQETVNKLNENGLVMDIFTNAIKVCDHYSNIKSNNFLCYAMAALWAKENKLNDALLLNPYNRIADATIANIFIVKNGVIKTPALTEGCIAGVMRRYVLKCLRNDNMPVEETAITIDDLKEADEVFLTNAIQGIKWVKQVGDNNYQTKVAGMLYKNFIQPLFV